MDMKSWRQEILESSYRIAIPILTHPGIDMIGCSVREAVSDGKKHFLAIESLAKAYPAAACCTIMDLTLEAEAFGAHILFPEDDIPTVEGRLLEGTESIDSLVKPSAQAARLPQMIKACSLAAQNIKDRPVFGGVIGPYSLAGRLYDMTELMIGCMCGPDAMEILLQKCTDFLISYCKELKATGINGLMIAEPAAGLISADDCMRFSTKYIQQIVKAVQDDGFIFILHNCGTSGHCADAMVATGAMGLHFGNRADMEEMLKVSPKDVLVMGNIDPVSLFLQASPEQMYQETMALLESTALYPNFVLSSGCDVPPHIPQDNITAFYKALNDFNLRYNG